jgi:phosphopantothenoylcysteine decarboxylase/phosphopantothenate--cysteine ligase
LPTPFGIEIHKVETAVQMRNAVFDFVYNADVLIMSAAVADFRPATAATQKIKKSSNAHNDRAGITGTASPFSLELVQNPDILKDLAEALDIPNSGFQRRLVRVGFAAETENVSANAQGKLAQKRLDLLVANDVSRSDSGFGTDTNKVSLFHANGVLEDLPVMPKTGVAAAIWDRVVPLLGSA